MKEKKKKRCSLKKVTWDVDAADNILKKKKKEH